MSIVFGTRSIALRALLLAGIGAGFPGNVSAQDGGLPISEGDEEIVVTAQRRTERLQDTPLAVTALSSEALAERGATQVENLKTLAPNVDINQGRADSAGSSIAIYIRGVGQNDFLFPNDPGVGLYVDGVYLARSVGANLDLTDVERIEVLRGPQGTLYGKNTIGGAINVYTIKPDLETTRGSVEFTVGRFNRIDAKSFVSLPLAEGRAALKVSGAVLKRDGFMIRSFDGKDLGDQNAQIIRGALRLKPAEEWDIMVQADYSRKRENGAPGVLVNVVPSENIIPGFFLGSAADPTPTTGVDLVDLFNAVVAPQVNASLGLPAGSRFDGRWITGSRFSDNGTGATRNNADVWGFSGTIEGALSDSLTLKSVTAYRKQDNEFARDGDHSPYDIVNTQNVNKQSQFSQEATLSLTAFDDRLNWILGGFYMKEKGSDSNLVQLLDPLATTVNTIPFPAPPAGPGTLTIPYGAVSNFNLRWRPFARINTDTYAVFSQATFKATDQLSLTLGGRYSYDKKRLFQRNTFDIDFGTYTGTGGTATDCYTCLADGVTGRTLVDSWGSFTPKAGVDYKINPDAMVYASYSKGFKSGGWSPRPTPTNPADLPFDPETLDTFEIGTKTQFLDRRVTLNVAGFYSIYKDIQLTTLQPDFVLQVINAGRNRMLGFEAELSARPTDNFDVTAAIGFLDNKYSRIPDSDPNFTTSDVLPDAAKWTINLGAQYRFDLNDTASLTVRADAAYRSKTFKELYNLSRTSLIQYGGATPVTTPINSGTDGYLVTSPELAQPGYWVANVRGTLAFADGLSVAAFVTNLFDKKYYTTVLPVSAFGYDEGYWGRPREWGLSIGYKF